MREALGRAMNAEDLSPQEYECAVDRLGALAFGNSIGSAMLWVHLAGQMDKFHEVSQKLTIHLSCQTGIVGDYLPVAKLALMEFLYPNCRACNGAAQGKNENGVLIDCYRCNGTGLHRYSDEERAKLTGLHWRPRFNRLVIIAHKLLSAGEIDAVYEVRRQLERDL